MSWRYAQIKVPVTVTEQDSFADQPSYCKNIQLYPHQLKSLHRMLLLERSGAIDVKKPGRRVEQPVIQQPVEEKQVVKKKKVVKRKRAYSDEESDESESSEEEHYDSESEEDEDDTTKKDESETEGGGESDEEVTEEDEGHHVEGNQLLIGGKDGKDFIQQVTYNSYDVAAIQSRVGILANKPGSGKSAIVLSLCGIPCDATHFVEVSKSNGYSSIKYSTERDTGIVDVKANLIVCNPKLVMQWAGYMKQFPQLRHHVVNLTRKGPSSVEDMVTMGNANDVIFIASSFFHTFCKCFERVRFQRVFIDEIDSMEFPSMAHSKLLTHFMWWVTATPESFISAEHKQVFKAFLNNSSNFKTDVFREVYTVKCSDEEIDASIQLPPYVLEDVFVNNSLAIRLTAGIIDDPGVQHLLQGDRIDQVIERLNVTNQTVSGLGEAMSIYLNYRVTSLQHTLIDLEALAVEELDPTVHTRLLTRMNAVRQQIADATRNKEIFSERIKSCTDCLICYDGLTNPVATKCCTQAFCFSCLEGWLNIKPSCPNCRARLDRNTGIVSQPHVNAEIKHEETNKKKRKMVVEETQRKRAAIIAENKEAASRPRTKVQALLKVLEPSMRSLLYVEDVQQAKTSEDALVQAGYKVLKVYGLTGVGAMNVLEKLRNCTSKTCLIVSSITQSAGFNLQCVDSIVMYQRMREREAQIIGRGMRPGRTEALKVFRILYDSEK